MLVGAAILSLLRCTFAKKNRFIWYSRESISAGNKYYEKI